MPIVYHNGSNYDYDSIIKELAEQFEGQFTCLGEGTEKYIIFSVPIETEVTKLDKKGKEITKTLSHRLQFMDSARFMVSCLLILVNNLTEGNHKIKCKYRHNSENCEACTVKYKDCECYLK